ncbi:MAG: site-specific DNA-methyltransferase, partial [Bacteroidales bacterium]|nr:site-specific DNA-methyltransferase [Bacteroidales bacterium]
MTPDIAAENIDQIKNLFPDVFYEGKIDFDKLKQVLGEYIENENERYNFTWNGKGKALRLAQTPSTGTLRPCKEESKNWNTTQNLYIEGDNLEVLKLLQKTYHNKIKMIYIDPPYNTGKDFIYPDDYKDNLENYLKLTGQNNEDGDRISTNSETSGRYHTNWLNMMYPRLRLARNLLADDGIIFISISEKELVNIIRISNEIFGEEHLIGTITWKARVKPVNIGDAKYRPQKETEFILVYEKTDFQDKFLPLITGGLRSYPYEIDGKKYRLTTILKSNRGTNFRSTMTFELEGYSPPDGQRWQAGEDVINQLNDDGYIEFKDGTPFRRYFEDEEGAEHDPFYCFMEVDWSSTSESGKNELNNILGNNHEFDTVKPTRLLRTLLSSCTQKNDIILDFFSGSSTTAHAVMQLNADDGGNRKFIMVQLPEPCGEDTEAAKAGYKNICEIGKERIRRAGEKIVKSEELKVKSEQGEQVVQGTLNSSFSTLNSNELRSLDVGFKVFKLDSSNLKKWNPDYDNLEASLEGMVSNYV